MRVLGLTGGIGSGKSEVAKMFAALGADVIDADELARDAVAPGTPGLEAIVRRFGDGILDDAGRLDRKKLGRLVFKDEGLRTALERIVHPEVEKRSRDQIRALAEKGSRLIVYDVPLLYESRLDERYAEVIVVNVDPRIQRERIARRDGLSAEEIEDRIASQMPLSEKARRATWIIDNSGTLEETRAEVKCLFEALTGGRVQS